MLRAALGLAALLLLVGIVVVGFVPHSMHGAFSDMSIGWHHVANWLDGVLKTEKQTPSK